MNQVEEVEMMDKNSKDWLYDYVETSHFSTRLFEVVERYQTHHEKLYRGIMYPINKLVVGETYRHDYPITSWTTKKAFAVDISLNKSLPDWAYEDAYFWKHGVGKVHYLIKKEECEELAKQFCPIVLIARDMKGVEVNAHILEHEWKNEEEVVVYQGKWQIMKVQECKYDGKRYFEVEVEKISD